MQLAGTTAVVTEVGRGIGPAIAQALIAEDVRVFGSARTETDESAQLAELSGFTFVSADPGSVDGVDALAHAMTGPVEVLVNNIEAEPAGADGFGPGRDWQRRPAQGLLAAARVTRALLGYLSPLARS
jgi:NAD(P)-dependent dehydrogenase (short-subunit alcohol dehydrogenase family)